MTLSLLLAQAQEVTPEDPASLAWPAVAGGVAAVATTVVIVGGVLWRGYRRLRKTVLEPLATLIADWTGRPAEHGRPARPGIPEQLAEFQRHLGNGADRPLRQIAERNAEQIAGVTDTAQRSQETAAAAHALAQQTATALAEHYVRGHGS